MDPPKVMVVQLSESFHDFWQVLARDLEAEVVALPPEPLGAVAPDVAAVLVSAGGAEREAAEWLEGSARPIEVPVYVVGADPGRRIAARVVGHGATDYFAVPDDVEVLRNTLWSAVERHRSTRSREASEAVPRPEAFSEIVGDSTAIRAVLTRAGRLLPHADATGLIVGETGTGKELFARAIHFGGSRRRAPFVPINCSALPAQLIEFELFGHERGAFTDAHAAKPGLFQVADGGTLFLDEVGALPLDLQAKLLRVLEDKEIRRVGGTKSHQVNVRILAATNENLEEAAGSGRFRQDLFYRLSVITLVLPPLRERGDDVVQIALALMERLASQHDLPAPPLTVEVRRELKRHAWPGNVRELKNALERSLLLSEAGTLNLLELLPQSPPHPEVGSPLPFPATLEDITTGAAHAMIELCSGNRSEAARRLGISRRRLRRLLDLRTRPT